MASINTFEWITRNADKISGNSIEVGSKKYKEHAFIDLRELLTSVSDDVTLIGCDLSAGDNVDVVLDMTDPFSKINDALQGKRFDTVFCISVLEHIPDVFTAAKNLTQLLNPGGWIFLSVPFVFRCHGYPGDYWRFTPQAIQFLFQQIDFRGLEFSEVSTMEKDDVMPIKNMDKINRFLHRPNSMDDIRSRKEAKKNGGEIPPYFLAPAMFNMLGQKVFKS